MSTGSPRNIVYVCNSASAGGANRSLSVILAGLDRDRFPPLVVIPKHGPFFDRLQELRVPAVILPLSSLARVRGSLTGRARGAIKKSINFVRLLQLLDSRPAALVHTNTVFPLSGALAAKLAGLPHVWHLREGLDLPLYSLRLGRPGTRALISGLSDHLICISDYVKNASVSSGAFDKTTVIHNALEEIPEPRATAVGPAPSIGCAGVISLQKRTSTFIEVAARLSRTSPRSRFLVAGRPTSGSEALLDQCQKRVSELGIEERFSWLGMVSDMDTVYRQIDILIHTGVHEGFGRVIMEAMARGIPVVSVASGAVPELIEDGVTGRVVEPDSIEALAQAVQDCLDPEVYSRLSRAARAAAVERFSPGRHVRRVMDVYNQILGANHAGGPAT